MAIHEELRELEDAINRIWNVEEQKSAYQLPLTAHQMGIKTQQPTLKCRRVLRGHFGKIYAMAWNQSDPRLLVSASQDGKLIVWNGMTNLKMAAIGLQSTWVMACGYSPGGEFVSSGGLDNLCSLYKLNPESARNGGQLYSSRVDDSNGPIVVLKGHEGYLSSCKFLSKSKVVTTSGDASIKLWDVETQRCTETFEGHLADVMSSSINEDGLLVTGSCDATSKVWDTRSGMCTNTFPSHESDVNSVTWFPKQPAFASGSDDAQIHLNDLRAYRTLNNYGNDCVVSGITSVDFTHTGTHIIASYDAGGCILWETLTGQKVTNLEGHENRVSCVGISSDGKALCTGSWDMMLRIWA